ncbi:hypothetical protein ACJRO7_001706 [Eucalyptus globulus]|uniref:Gnk2-homologous domain-containing protein n=1 Tax=Eucalyptus globulus TaxID=34317 RepID=A0ABD3LRV4_EUCGL
MSSARFVLLSLFSALLLRTALGDGPLFHFCTSGNFTANSPYESNLNKLTSFLHTKTPPSGFALDSIGRHQHRVYGIALCRGDVSPSVCKACVADAGAEIQRLCPRNKGAIMWYDDCMFNDPALFNLRVTQMLTRLAKKAYSIPKLYAVGKKRVDGKTTLKTGMSHGLVQCTRDLSAAECKACLEGEIGAIPIKFSGQEGGRLGGASCNFRYETYRFFSI